MILLIHVIIALASIVQTTYLFFKPSKSKLHASYAFVAATLTSGTFLVVTSHAPMLQACTTGLIYIGAMSLGIVSARHKLAKVTISKS